MTLAQALPRWTVWQEPSGWWRAVREYHGAVIELGTATPEALLAACQHLDRVDP